MVSIAPARANGSRARVSDLYTSTKPGSGGSSSIHGALDVFLAEDFDGRGTCEMGFMVVHKDDPQQPVAFVPSRDSERTGNDRDDAFQEASRIAGDPNRLGWNPFVTDLRPYGRIDSMHPTPEWLYGIRLSPIDNEGNETDEPLITLRPFCRFRMAELVIAFNRVRWTPEQLAECPHHTLQITEDEGGLGHAYAEEIGAEPGSTKLPMTRMDYWARCNDLYRLMCDRLPASHPLVKRFREILRPDQDNYIPELAEVEYLATSFNVADNDAMRAVLAGWKNDPDPIGVDEVRRFDTTSPVGRFLYIRKVNGTPLAGFDYRISDSTHPVDISFREGCTKEEATTALTETLAIVNEKWDRLITDPDHAFDDAPPKPAKVARRRRGK